MKRKEFIRRSGMLVLGSQLPVPSKTKKQIGIQLWSLRTAMAANVDNALREVARAGYSFVEPAGHDAKEGTFHKVKPKDLKRKVEDLGMKMYSAHCQVKPENATEVCEQAVEAGLKYVIRPSPGGANKNDVDSFKKIADDFNKIGEVAKKYGMQFGFHNHATELEMKDGQSPYHILLQNTDPDKVVFQMDIGWVIFARQSPVEYFEKYPGRFPLWHIRDLDPVTRDSVAIGKGNIDFAPIFKEQKKAGLKYGIVEIGSKDEADAFSNIRFSHDYLSKAKFY